MSKEQLVKEILKYAEGHKKSDLLKMDNLSLHDILRDLQLKQKGI